MPFGRRPIVGAYICPRGVYVAVCRADSRQVQIDRAFEHSVGIGSAHEAASRLATLLQENGVRKARLAIAVRGFGVTHHTLALPPASDDVLTPVIEREIRRLEPGLADPIVSWVGQRAIDERASGPVTRQVFASAAPRALADALSTTLTAAGHTLSHLTSLPSSIQRLLEQFDSGTGTTVTVAPLPDAAFVGFSLNGGLRLIVEPPIPPDARYDTGVLNEEVDLGAMFLRQQFGGAHLDRVILAGTLDSLTDIKTQFAERLAIPVKQLALGDLSPSGFAALGAVLDYQSAAPMALAGEAADRPAARARGRWSGALRAATVVFAVVAGWTFLEAAFAVRARYQLRGERQRLESEGLAIDAFRPIADQRRHAANARDAVGVVARERQHLRATLGGIAAALGSPASPDTISLRMNGDQWHATVAGRIKSTTNARAVQTLHEAYRELPQRIALDSLRLDHLAYDDSADRGDATVRFRLSFTVPVGGRE